MVLYMIKDVDVVVEHIFRERNKGADFITNHVFFFAGTYNIKYSNFQELPRKAKTLHNTDQSQIPNLRIKKLQNKDFNNERGLVQLVLLDFQ